MRAPRLPREHDRSSSAPNVALFVIARLRSAPAPRRDGALEGAASSGRLGGLEGHDASGRAAPGSHGLTRVGPWPGPTPRAPSGSCSIPTRAEPAG